MMKTSKPGLPPSFNSLLVVACCLLGFGKPIASIAAVEAVQIRLLADLGQSTSFAYEVPAGKVLIIEHLVFVNYWDNQNQDKYLFIRNGGTGTGGSFWDTRIDYSANFNTLFRPLKLPAGTGISLPNLDNVGFQLFIYGLLVDETDLYASIPAEMKNVARTPTVNPDSLEGTLELESPRPAIVQAEQSQDLKEWEGAEGVSIKPGSSSKEKSFAFDLPPASAPYFVRFTARSLLREDYPNFRRSRLISANGTITTPFLAPSDDVAKPRKENSGGN